MVDLLRIDNAARLNCQCAANTWNTIFFNHLRINKLLGILHISNNNHMMCDVRAIWAERCHASTITRTRTRTRSARPCPSRRRRADCDPIRSNGHHTTNTLHASNNTTLHSTLRKQELDTATFMKKS
jgi:hypothetical protein